MLPIVAVLARHVLHKAVESHAKQAFAGKVKPQQKPVVLQPAHLELERVELTPAEVHQAPAKALLRRIQDSLADGQKAFARLQQPGGNVSPKQLEDIQAQADRCNDELAQLSQAVQHSLAALKSAAT